MAVRPFEGSDCGYHSVLLIIHLFVLRNEVRSTFNLWVSLLSETRKMSRERAAFGEVLASEMTSRLDIMAKDVQMLTKKVAMVVAMVASYLSDKTLLM